MLLYKNVCSAEPEHTCARALQTGTCEALRPWSRCHAVALAAEVLSLAVDAGALRVQIRIVNNNTSHPAFWVRLALQRPLKATGGVFQEGQSSE